MQQSAQCNENTTKKKFLNYWPMQVSNDQIKSKAAQVDEEQMKTRQDKTR